MLDSATVQLVEPAVLLKNPSRLFKCLGLEDLAHGGGVIDVQCRRL